MAEPRDRQPNRDRRPTAKASLLAAARRTTASSPPVTRCGMAGCGARAHEPVASVRAETNRVPAKNKRHYGTLCRAMPL